MGIYVKINIYKLEPFDHTCSGWKYSALFSRVDLQQIEGPWGGSRYNRIYIYIQIHIHTLYIYKHLYGTLVDMAQSWQGKIIYGMSIITVYYLGK